MAIRPSSTHSANTGIPPRDEGRTLSLASEESPSTKAFQDMRTPAKSSQRKSKKARLHPHPSSFEKETKEYRDAVGAFFEMTVEPSKDIYADWMLSYSSYDGAVAPLNDDTFEHIHGIQVQKCRPSWTLSESERIARVMLTHYVEPTVTTVEIPVQEPKGDPIFDLRRSYADVCKTVAEIELSASTLRTNSRALTLAKKLVEECAYDVFQILSTHRWSETIHARSITSHITLPKEVKTRLEDWVRERSPSGWMRTKVTPHDPVTARNGEWAQFERVGSGRFPKDVQVWKQALREKKQRKWTKKWQQAKGEARKRIRVQLCRRLRDETDVYGIDSIFRLEVSNYERHPDLKWLHNWMGKDKRLHPGGWNDHSWEYMQRWLVGWDDEVKQVENRVRRMEHFAETCVDLMNELGKIDGSASVNDLNVVSPEDEDLLILQHCIVDLEIEVGTLDGAQEPFIRLCNDIFILLEKRLRSNELRQGLETLVKKQDHLRNTFMDFATVAIFFSSITATTLQFSFDAADQSVSSTIVNLCWFASLVLSVASATNSFLGAVVHQSPEYLRPSANLDFRLLQSWFKFIPPALLSISGLLFLFGICAFTFLSTSNSPNQGTAVKHATVAITSTNVLTLLVVLLLAYTRVFHWAARVAVQLFHVLRIAVHSAYPWIRLIGELAYLTGSLVLILFPSILDIIYGIILYRRLSWDNGSRFGTFADTTLHRAAKKCFGALLVLFFVGAAVKALVVTFVRCLCKYLKLIVQSLSPFRRGSTSNLSTA